MSFWKFFSLDIRLFKLRLSQQKNRSISSVNTYNHYCVPLDAITQLYFSFFQISSGMDFYWLFQSRRLTKALVFSHCLLRSFFSLLTIFFYYWLYLYSWYTKLQTYQTFWSLKKFSSQTACFFIWFFFVLSIQQSCLVLNELSDNGPIYSWPFFELFIHQFLQKYHFLKVFPFRNYSTFVLNYRHMFVYRRHNLHWFYLSQFCSPFCLLLTRSNILFSYFTYCTIFRNHLNNFLHFQKVINFE